MKRSNGKRNPVKEDAYSETQITKQALETLGSPAEFIVVAVLIQN